ncbi:hypothetical protein OIN59_16915 [Acidovorax sp. D2M1]|uniref:Uncharacterized protein n=1 Tax=Acidovorax benzenivorans TaxID=2987520 RepID=A0ABT5S102_9BURK|nr:hypothetical protein [Acidovorax benzenivorans]MDD2179121.1 hypothetical protein [Acidovorax benzenivorans]
MLQARLPTAPHYRDRKRYAWLLSLVVPCTMGVGPALMWWTGEPPASASTRASEQRSCGNTGCKS